MLIVLYYGHGPLDTADAQRKLSALNDEPEDFDFLVIFCLSLFSCFIAGGAAGGRMAAF